MTTSKASNAHMAESAPADFVREIGLWEALAIALATMIGAGILLLPAVAAGRAGPGAILAYLIAGVIALVVALVIAELATGIPGAGGSYRLAARALGPLGGAIMGPISALGLILFLAFCLTGLARYVAYFIPLPVELTVVLTGLIFLWWNYCGAKPILGVQLVVLAALVLFVLSALFDIEPAYQQPFLPQGWGAVLGSVGLVMVAFIGFEKVASLAGEMEEPDHNVPRALIGAVVIATLLYGAVLYVVTGLLPAETLAASPVPLIEAGPQAMSVIGVAILALAGLLALGSTINVGLVLAGRIGVALGQDRVLPRWFSRLHSRFLSPHRTILVTGILVMALALLDRPVRLAETASALFMLAYALLSVSVITLRRERPDWYDPTFQVPLYPVLPALGIILPLGVLLTLDWRAVLAALAVVGLGALWYLIWGKGRARAPIQITADRWTEEVPGNAILVPVANPETAQQLVTLAAGWGRHIPNTKVVALRLVALPLSVPLRLAQDYVAEQNESLREALAVSKGIAERRDFPLATRLHLTHDVSKGIVNAAEVHLGVRLILLGWHGAVTHSRVRWNVDQQVIQSNPGATAVFLNRGLTHAPRKILVPMGGGPHARLGLRLAYQLLPDDGELVAFRVATMAEASAEALEGIADAIRIQIEEEMGIATDGRIAIKAVPGGAGEANIVIEAIAQEAAQGYDLVVIGASDEWRWNNWLFGSIPDQVADQAPCSVLLVRAAQDLGHQLYVPVEEA